MTARAAGAVIGAVFGVMLVWSGMASPDVIRQALLFEDSYLFLFMFSAMSVAALGQYLVRRSRARSILTGSPLEWTPDRPEPRHFTGAALFGVGWGLANVCPAPIATQLGQGIGWALLTFAGVVIGIRLFQRQGAHETEPAVDPPAPATASATERQPLPGQPIWTVGSPAER